ncbi:uncharacterized protein B0H18DRAFT_1022074 [Fomitopsis serialis]|uniref:uncharacterized protein n=1 Tax=Fomitopsis serialis TaxID=139415 RepID=UPI0020087670|nr:uncharacterized protein B0H18DRAFT_1022074 [Neoantrodia serialis]KAH9921132.1 hypothetical protein B0H18DRAFT_1022074 [Neoantrodia serialis]
MYSRSMKGSFTATTSMSPWRRALRSTIRPIRPKPLIPTLTGMADVDVDGWV